nr:gamma-glutamyl-gamma-aminobutyrate hydrolase family protein [Clostridia bacterium]
SMPRGEEDTAKHDVDVLPGTLLRRVLGRDRMRIASFHSWAIPPDQDLVAVNAWSAKGDGVVEGVEIGDRILGVQGHPEVDGLLPELFAFLAED